MSVSGVSVFVMTPNLFAYGPSFIFKETMVSFSQTVNKLIFLFEYVDSLVSSPTSLTIREEADRVKGRGRRGGRRGETREREEGEEGAGGGKRGGGRREKRGREEGEGRKKGREENFALQKGGGRRGGGRGEGKGAGGGRGLPPCPPPHKVRHRSPSNNIFNKGMSSHTMIIKC